MKEIAAWESPDLQVGHVPARRGGRQPIGITRGQRTVPIGAGVRLDHIPRPRPIDRAQKLQNLGRKSTPAGSANTNAGRPVPSVR